jgi:hypothetical protein
MQAQPCIVLPLSFHVDNIASLYPPYTKKPVRSKQELSKLDGYTTARIFKAANFIFGQHAQLCDSPKVFQYHTSNSKPQTLQPPLLFHLPS